VYQDDFGTSCSSTSSGLSSCANGVSPNTTKWNYQEITGGPNAVAYYFNTSSSGDARIVNNWSTDDSYGTGYLSKRLGGTLSPVGSDGVYGTYLTSDSKHINDIFSDNTVILEWSFLFYLSSVNNLGLSNGLTYYGGAFVLGSTQDGLDYCGTSTRQYGYAVSFAEGDGRNH
jgi:hypothetical protein